VRTDSKGEKVRVKAHGGPIEIEGITVATVDDQVRLRKVETWFDPMAMFRQVAPDGLAEKEKGPDSEETLTVADAGAAGCPATGI
jgi:hypothetical protein